MSENEPMWQSPCLPTETVADAAARFVRETFGVDRSIVWGATPGEFRFADGYWCYRVVFNGGHWQVFRMSKMTAKAQSRAKARAEIKAARGGE